MSSPGVHRHFSTPKFDKEPKKALNRIRVYVRFRAHVTVFCLRDGESRSALPRRGTKSHLILQSRRQVLLVVDEEGQFGAVRSGLSSIYMIRMGLRLV